MLITSRDRVQKLKSAGKSAPEAVAELGRFFATHLRKLDHAVPPAYYLPEAGTDARAV